MINIIEPVKLYISGLVLFSTLA